ncbi:MAG: tRNA pseudouridine(55) synthase TruB [Flavobacteriaceae bacterium TMED116]|nr:MAG: tRNA pseudouridine(55) synthase TruB [Flavobacteriaceae bacterium TMED116]|tara:strand:- start:309 stop:1016 length:708 start_codon:yes stop_codon:yes gene_type:complete
MKVFDNKISKSEIYEGRFILINKPISWTSFQVVNKVRYIIKKLYNIDKLKVGHTGTLDPLASGLLILAIGKATKHISKIQNMKKIYTGTMNFGCSTPSFDMETKPNNFFSTIHINESLIKNKINDFIGIIDQFPPAYSALKINGKPMYKYARENKKIKIEPRKVKIDRFEFKSYKPPKFHFEVECSKGTYIRSLANDFGKKLDSGAYLTNLVRTNIGKYNIKNASQISDFEKLIK